MKLEMSEKDKKLLFGLAIFVIVVCFGYWGIFPIIMEMQDLDDEIIVQSDLEQVNSMKITELVWLEADNQTYEEEILAARANFYNMMTSDEIDKEFTGRALDHNLLVYDLTISMPTDPAELAPYQYSRRALYGEEEDSEEDWGTDIGGEDIWGNTSSDILSSDDLLFMDMEEEETTGVYCASISMNLNGNMRDLQDMLEELLDEGIKIRLCSFGYETSRGNAEGGEHSFDMTIENKLSVSFEIYMCEE